MVRGRRNQDASAKLTMVVLSLAIIDACAPSRSHTTPPSQPPHVHTAHPRTQGGNRHNWTQRHFCLSRGLLLYYVSAPPSHPQHRSPSVAIAESEHIRDIKVEPQGFVPISGATAGVVKDAKYDFVFEVRVRW